MKYLACGAAAVGLLLTAALVFGMLGDRFDEDPGSETFKTQLPPAFLSTLFVGTVLGSCLGETYCRLCARESA